MMRFIALVSVLPLAAAMGQTPLPQPSMTLADEAALERIGAQYAEVEAATSAEIVQGFAELEADPALRRAVVALYPGTVTVRHVGVGDEVTLGDPLLELVSPAALADQDAYLDAQNERALADQALVRDELLHADGLIAESRLASTRASAARAGRRTQRLALTLETAGVDVARLVQDSAAPIDLVIRAPFAGQVTHVAGDPGEALAAGDFVAEIVRFDRLVASIHVPVRAAVRLAPGMAVELENALGSGQVAAISRAANPQDQTVEVRAFITEPSPRLAIGQRVAASIALGAETDLRRVPSVAVVTHSGHDGVFVMTDGQVMFERISGGSVSGGWRRFSQGPEPGARVVVTGTAALKAKLAEEHDA